MKSNRFLGKAYRYHRVCKLGNSLLFFAFLLISVLLVLIVVGNESLLPASYIGAFFRGIDEWFANRAKDVELNYRQRDASGEIIVDNLQMARQRLSGDLVFGEDRGEFIARILRIFGYSLLCLLGLGLLVFLLRPLFSHESRETWKNLHPLQKMKEKLLHFISVLGKACLAFVKWLRSPKKGVRRLASTIAQRLKESPIFSREVRLARRREQAKSALRKHGRVIKAFVRVIRWGEGFGVEFRKSFGPMEYALKIGEAVPDSQDVLFSVAGIFEEIIFSKDPVPENRTEEFFQKVQAVLQTQVPEKTLEKK